MAMKVDSYTLRGKLTPLLRRFEEAQASDADAEKRIKKAGCTGGLLLVGGFFGFFPAAWAADLAGPAVFAVPVAAIVAAIVFFVKAVKLSKFDLDNRKVDCVVRLLRMLRADTPRDADLTLELDLRPYKDGGQKLDEEGGGFGNPKRIRYQHAWLTLSGSLADGTRYKLGVTENVARKEKPKRKGRVKVKEQTRGTIQLQLRLKASRYGDAAVIAQQLQQLAPRPPLALREVKGSGPSLMASFVTAPHVKITARRGSGETGEENLISSDALLAAMLWAYDGIGRTGSAGTGQG